MADSEPLTSLRGAGVGDVDSRRLGRVVIYLVLGALAVSAALLFVAGARKNAQITALKAHGVPVGVTVTGCHGLIGGSGSNAAGYDCGGSYVVGGRRYHQDIPDDTLHATGSVVRGVTVRSDPTLLSTPSIVAEERASASVYVLPGALALVFVAGAGTWAVIRRRRSRAP